MTLSIKKNNNYRFCFSQGESMLQMLYCANISNICTKQCFTSLHGIKIFRVSQNVNYRLWVVMICQHRFISCNRCITLVQNFEIGG